MIYGYDDSNKTLNIGDPWPSYQRYQTMAYNDYLSNDKFRWAMTITDIHK